MVKSIRVEEMRRHVENLATANDIIFNTRGVKRTAHAFAIREADGAADEVQTPPIRSAITYATALHEIGHILGQHQHSRHSMTRERWAWRWARANAIVWTPAMERFAATSLARAKRNAYTAR